MQSKILNQFNQTYWDEMYAKEEGTIIDGVDNAKSHAKYLRSILKLAETPIQTLGDFGFGKGILLHEMAKEFKPKKIIAIDPSVEAIMNLKKQKWIQKVKKTILQEKVETVSEHYFKTPIDLALCNSIVQYVQTKDIDLVFLKLARFCKYLYFSVPTKLDYGYMNEQVNFKDPYSFSRTKKFYKSAIAPYFTLVSYNLLESKLNVKDSGFVFDFFRL